ncbi:MAG: LysM peptidoglycan-binding domain-containing protein [Dehalococcoidia bacterium]|nr:LysM peptidoglycan-binding domain-containing protein [Dehalococcoidia bacterium]
MSYPNEQDEFPAVCPYLGLADDADSHATYATEAHRCYRLDSPTRIATGHQETYCLGANHVTCPVYRGEGIGAAAPAAAAAAQQGPRGRAPRGAPAPLGSGAAKPQPRRQATLERPRRGPATLNPRPRAGGISMPIATIGLFALAIIVIGVAFAIQQAVGGGDDSGLSPADRVATNDALAKTQPARTATPGNAQTQTAQARTPGATTTATTGATTTGTAAPNPKSYTVVSGDTCSGIAQAHNITDDQFFAANPDISRDCKNLAVGQVVKLP